MEKQQKDQTVIKCEWCGKKIKKKATISAFLTGVMGYYYCNEECEQSHIYSK